MFGIGLNFRCQLFPWHRIVTRWKLTEQADKLVCSCGQEYGYLHTEGFLLPWKAVRELYEGPGSILRPPPTPQEGQR